MDTTRIFLDEHRGKILLDIFLKNNKKEIKINIFCFLAGFIFIKISEIVIPKNM